LIAIVLAGGYGTRLGEVSKGLPKPLLRVAGRPMIDHVFERISELDDVRRIIISTNLRFEEHFRRWLDSESRRQAEVIADRSYSEQEKPGAIASLTKTVSNIDDDCLILAGDNLFTSSLKPMIQTFKAKSHTVVALYDIKDLELTRHYSTITLDPDNRITDLIEKPTNPTTTLIGTCIYALPKNSLSRMSQYLSEASDRDNTGRFIGWLCKREPVYGHILQGHWWDIGTIDQLNEADRILKRT